MNFLICKARYGSRVVPCLFILVFSLLLPGFADSTAKQSAVQKAQELQLWNEPYWHTLVHYKPAFFGRYKSLVDDPQFFCAANGKTNPRAELEATISSFFEQKTDSSTKHAIERFPGRFKWICEKLELNSTDFPFDGDAAYRALYEKLNPDSIYLVFPAGYLKRPASVFGHTFLLVETKNKPRLTANSINYGAVTTMSGGPLYAILGLVGGFHGYYGFEAYYEKIKQYSDMDMRDMWEYRLNLSDEEKDRLLRHVFDLAGIYSRYYFTGENCSYNLLFLLEAARPSTQITQKISGVVEPVETVKLVYNSNLTDKIEYRPSVYSKLESEKKNLTSSQQRFAKKICFGKKTAEEFPFTDSPLEQQAAFWDLCADYLGILLHSNKITSDEYRPRYLAVLSARRKLGKVQTQKTQIPESPEKAHGSKKIAAEAGRDINGNFAGASFRLTAHEQLESFAGYSENSELSFANIDLRYSFSQNKFALNRADLLSIVSLPSSDRFFFNGATVLLTGLEQNLNKDGTQNFAWRLKSMYGFSIRPVNLIQFYALGGADFYFSPRYNYGTQAFAGGEGGFIAGNKNLKAKAYGSFMVKVFEKDYTRLETGLDTCFTLSQNLALKGGYSFIRNYEDFWHCAKLSFNVYF